MMPTMLLIIVGVLTIIMGANAIQKGEIPLTRTKNITGPSTKILGALLILFGLGLSGLAILGRFIMSMVR